ncbi:dihydroxyacetone kinase 1 [Cryptococcus neoformans Tu401-1]|nr:dihydroxyacetone kinase 1 [Cryptococcus neoformans var. grubii Bt85]OXG17206.1 dihydroxyacetone kinase 1 [Cryptococcus neoformans var. grubii Tu401-1]OXM78783.1 dihydroxyacetone kinase 1 [Cryptococcus neoformans var. grubii Bt63]
MITGPERKQFVGLRVRPSSRLNLKSRDRIAGDGNAGLMLREGAEAKGHHEAQCESLHERDCRDSGRSHGAAQVDLFTASFLPA